MFYLCRTCSVGSSACPTPSHPCTGPLFLLPRSQLLPPHEPSLVHQASPLPALTAPPPTPPLLPTPWPTLHLRRSRSRDPSSETMIIEGPGGPAPMAATHEQPRRPTNSQSGHSPSPSPSLPASAATCCPGHASVKESLVICRVCPGSESYSTGVLMNYSTGVLMNHSTGVLMNYSIGVLMNIISITKLGYLC